MKVQHIQALVAVADAGSLRGAAEKLGKTQPALTKSLRQAEETLGIPIFQRSSRGVIPTRLGESVLSRARTVSIAFFVSIFMEAPHAQPYLQCLGFRVDTSS